MTTPGWKTRVFRVLLALICVLVAAWYSPLITAAVWRIFHLRGMVEYRGLRVAVPWPWTTEGDPDSGGPGTPAQGLSLKKTPFTMDRRLTNQSIFVTVISPDGELTAEQQTAAWMQAFEATHPGAVFDSRTPVPVPKGATCVSARSHWNEHGVVWTCISVQSGWVADFEGQMVDEAAFFRIANGLKR